MFPSNSLGRINQATLSVILSDADITQGCNKQEVEAAN